MVNGISEAGQRLARYEKQIASVVEGWRWQPVVAALMSLRGVAWLPAATLVTELLAVCTVLYVLFSYVQSGLATVEDFRSPVAKHPVHPVLGRPTSRTCCSSCSPRF